MVAEQGSHLGGRLQASLAIGQEARPRLHQRRVRADAGHHVVQRAAALVMIDDIVHRQQRDRGGLGKRRQTVQPSRVRRAIALRGRKPGPLRRERSQPSQGGFHIRHQIRRGDERQQQSVGELRQVGEGQAALALHRPVMGRAPADQPRQPTIGGAVGDIGQNVGKPILEGETRADDQRQAAGLGGHMRPDHPRQGVEIGHRQGRELEIPRRLNQLLSERRAPQEGIGGHDGQFGIGGPRHANSPCRYQRGGDASP